MKSLLVVTPRYPYPVIGGDRLRIYHVCKALSEHFKLTLLSLCDTEDQMLSPIPDDGVFDRIERVYLSRGVSRLKAFFAAPTGLPLQVAYYRSDTLRERIAQEASKHDGLLAHLIRTGDAIRHLPQPKFLEMTDAISLNYKRISSERTMYVDLRSLIFRLEAKRLYRYERAIVDDFDHSFLVSEVDRDFLFEGDLDRLSRVSVASNGVDLFELPFNFSPTCGDLVFIGNMSSLQNLDAVQFMAKQVLPLIRSERPEVRLRIIGRIGGSERAKLNGIDGVHVIGQVDSVSSAARGGAVGVCPVRLGAGIQNKVLEYMALGLPTVSTKVGLEGLSAKKDIDLFVADEPEAFAAHVLCLLNDRNVARRMAESGRRYVELNHGWDSVLRPMLEAIKGHFG
jgi:glycosyltransferase involved in cell wall biosynthesis